MQADFSEKICWCVTLFEWRDVTHVKVDMKASDICTQIQ